MLRGPMNGEKHYHIRWSHSNIDWQPFPTREEAIETAEQINNKKESYDVLEGDSNCERCRAFKAEASRLPGATILILKLNK